MLSEAEVGAIAAEICHAEQTGELAEAPSSRHPDVTVEDG